MHKINYGISPQFYCDLTVILVSLATMQKVTIIGSGKVATQLALGLFQANIDVIQVWSRTSENAENLAQKVQGQFIANLSEISNEADCILIAVKDDVIHELALEIPQGDYIIAHTSGTKLMQELNTHKNFGVFYPLQTFSKTKSVDLNTIPFCIEGNTELVEHRLFSLASKLSNDVRIVSSEDRKKIHLAAVFACNFSNHMLTIAEDILTSSGNNLSILHPLVNETIAKAFLQSPKKAQTGPAIREDQEVLSEQMQLLEGSPEYQKIYQLISDSIQKT